MAPSLVLACVIFPICGMLLFVDEVVSQDTWQMIDDNRIGEDGDRIGEDAQYIESSAFAGATSPSPMPAPVESSALFYDDDLVDARRSWSGTLQFIALDRDDGLDLTWYSGANQQRAKVTTDINSGVRLVLIREMTGSETSDFTTQNNAVGFVSFLSANGEGRQDFFSNTVVAKSQLQSTSMAIGNSTRVLGGRTRALVGVRYTHVADQYDTQHAGGLVDPPWIDSENHVITLDGTLQGDWYWRRLVFSAGITGGWGGNWADQQGWWDTAVTPSSFFLASISEAMANVNCRLTETTSLNIGGYGFLATGVLLSSDAFNGPADPETLRMVGLTFGLQQKF